LKARLLGIRARRQKLGTVTPHRHSLRDDHGELHIEKIEGLKWRDVGKRGSVNEILLKNANTSKREQIFEFHNRKIVDFFCLLKSIKIKEKRRMGRNISTLINEAGSQNKFLG